MLKHETFRVFLGVAGTALIIAFALYLLDWHGLLQSIKRISAPSALACILLCLATHLLIAWRWAILKSSDGRPALRDMLVTCHASIYNLVTPAAVGADAYRLMDAHVGSQSLSRSAGLLLLDRILGIWAQSAAFLAGYALLQTPRIAPALGLALPVFAVLAVLLPMGLLILRFSGFDSRSKRDGKIARIMGEILGALTEHSFKINVSAAFLSLFAVGTWIVAAIVVSQPIGVALGHPAIAMITVATELARLIPISLQGIGVREATFSWLTAESGGNGEAGFVACGLLYALNYLVVTGLGSWAGFVLKRRSKPS